MINTTNGVITWTPTAAQAPSTNTFATAVWDNGSPSLFAFNSFTVTVLQPPPPPNIKAITLNPGQVVLTWDSATNHTYRLQYCDSLSTTNWQNVTPDFAAAGQTLSATNTIGSSPCRFFRVLQLP